jgi:hypothetical protein
MESWWKGACFQKNDPEEIPSESHLSDGVEEFPPVGQNTPGHKLHNPPFENS